MTMRVMEMMSTVSLHMQRELKCKSLVQDGWVVLSRKSVKKEPNTKWQNDADLAEDEQLQENTLNM